MGTKVTDSETLQVKITKRESRENEIRALKSSNREGQLLGVSLVELDPLQHV